MLYGCIVPGLEQTLKKTCFSDSANSYAFLSLWLPYPYHSYTLRVEHSVPHAAAYAAGLFSGHYFVFTS
jgi:hypothetical protein